MQQCLAVRVTRCAEHTPGACDPGTYEGPSIAAVINWANNVGIDNQHFTNDSGQAVRGLVAKHDIPPKTTLVSMHRSMALSMIIGQNSPFPDLIPNDVWRLCGECVFKRIWHLLTCYCWLCNALLQTSIECSIHFDCAAALVQTGIRLWRDTLYALNPACTTHHVISCKHEFCHFLPMP